MVLVVGLVASGGTLPALLALQHGLLAAFLAFILVGNSFAALSLLILFPPSGGSDQRT